MTSTTSSSTGSVRSIIAMIAATVILHLAAALALLVSIVTLFQARRFVSGVIICQASRLVLFIGGVDVVVHGDRQWPKTQTVYVFNHTSSLDLFVVCALGLPDVRFFLKRKFVLFVPMGLLAALAGTFFTAPQTQPTTRTRLFQRATRVLQRTGGSVFLSPEGTRVTSGEIGPFNKGAFHLAAALGAPIVPLYFATPKSSDPGKGLRVGSGTVHVHVLPTVSTTSWSIEHIDVHRDELYALFCAQHERLRLSA